MGRLTFREWFVLVCCILCIWEAILTLCTGKGKHNLYALCWLTCALAGVLSQLVITHGW